MVMLESYLLGSVLLGWNSGIPPNATKITIFKENWAHQDSNLEPSSYEPDALTIELWAL